VLFLVFSSNFILFLFTGWCFSFFLRLLGRKKYESFFKFNFLKFLYYFDLFILKFNLKNKKIH
jgi:hypothetical protein